MVRTDWHGRAHVHIIQTPIIVGQAGPPPPNLLRKQTTKNDVVCGPLWMDDQIGPNFKHLDIDLQYLVQATS